MWQNTLSHLQSAHIRALSDSPGTEVTIVGLEPLAPARTALGWSVPNFGNARVIGTPDVTGIAELIERAGADCVHILAGWRGLRNGTFLVKSLGRRKARIGLITEGADFRGWKGLARRGIYTFERVRAGRRFDFILAMGTQGARWFTQCGYPAHTVFPYGYVVERPPEAMSNSVESQRLEFLFLGQLIARKGVDTLLRALAGLRRYQWRLTVVGEGPERPTLSFLAERLGIGERIRLLPALPYLHAMGMFREADLFILPSRFDGWGAVVNESLMAGVPVLCSNRCGAKDLVLGSTVRGEVFDAGSVGDLRKALERRIAIGKRTRDTTSSIRAWSKCIEGDNGARYVLKVLSHVYFGTARPSAIWSPDFESDTQSA